MVPTRSTNGIFLVLSTAESKTLMNAINPLKPKRKLLYLKTQFEPRSKHFSPRL